MKKILVIILIIAFWSLWNRPLFAALNTHSIDLESTSSQFLSATDSASIPTSGDFTIEAWINTESQPGADAQYEILSQHNDAAGARNFRFEYDNSGGINRIRFQVGTSPEAINQTLTNATWYHAAVVFDDTANSAEVFINATSIGTMTAMTSARDDTTEDLKIGARNTTETSFFDGLIDEVRLWSDKRTGTEITNNYQDHIVGNEANLVGYWRLNNDLTDTSGIIGTMTNNASAVFSTNVPFAGTAEAENPSIDDWWWLIFF